MGRFNLLYCRCLTVIKPTSGQPRGLKHHTGRNNPGRLVDILCYRGMCVWSVAGLQQLSRLIDPDNNAVSITRFSTQPPLRITWRSRPRSHSASLPLSPANRWPVPLNTPGPVSPSVSTPPSPLLLPTTSPPTGVWRRTGGGG